MFIAKTTFCDEYSFVIIDGISDDQNCRYMVYFIAKYTLFARIVSSQYVKIWSPKIWAPTIFFTAKTFWR